MKNRSFECNLLILKGVVLLVTLVLAIARVAVRTPEESYEAAFSDANAMIGGAMVNIRDFRVSAIALIAGNEELKGV